MGSRDEAFELIQGPVLGRRRAKSFLGGQGRIATTTNPQTPRFSNESVFRGGGGGGGGGWGGWGVWWLGGGGCFMLGGEVFLPSHAPSRLPRLLDHAS